MATQFQANMELAPMPPRAKAVLEEAYLERQREARIYSRTRGVMVYHTERMFALASRDYQRQRFAPMKQTRPALRMRRYSVDVNTCDNNLVQTKVAGSQVGHLLSCCLGHRVTPSSRTAPTNSKLTQTQAQQPRASELKHQALELIAPSWLPLPFPTPYRYYDFNAFYPSTPPHTDATYLSLDNASLTNTEYLTITRLTGWCSFMSDNALDTAFAILSQEKGCQDAQIRIASTIEAQVCFYADPGGKEAYSSRFAGQRWIFIPVNDGLGAQLNVGTQGAHWMLVALDRVHKRMHYYDSFAMGHGDYWATAVGVAKGMLGIVGEDEEEWEFVAEWNSPHQYRDNYCSADAGPCGPFVYTMVSLLIDEILRCQEACVEDQCYLRLHQQFPGQFAGWWDSEEMRDRIQLKIAHVKKRQDVERWATEHDRIAVEGEVVEFVEEPTLGSDVHGHDTGSDQPSDSDASELSDVTLISDQPTGSEVIELSSDEDEEMASVERAATPASEVLRSSSGHEQHVIPTFHFTADDVVGESSDEAEDVFVSEL